MVRADVIYLIAENPEAHGIFDKPQEEPRMVYCEVGSVGYNEYYTALANGLNPTIVFKLAERTEYHGEKIVTWNNVRYRITRTYVNKKDGIELTCEEVTTDAES